MILFGLTLYQSVLRFRLKYIGASTSKVLKDQQGTITKPVNASLIAQADL